MIEKNPSDDVYLASWAYFVCIVMSQPTSSWPWLAGLLSTLKAVERSLHLSGRPGAPVLNHLLCLYKENPWDKNIIASCDWPNLRPFASERRLCPRISDICCLSTTSQECSLAKIGAIWLTFWKASIGSLVANDCLMIWLFHRGLR